MDMSYLLWVQDLRNGIEAALDSKAVSIFFEELSFFALTWLIFIPVLVYWTINKRNGLFLLASMGNKLVFQRIREDDGLCLSSVDSGCANHSGR